MNRAITTLAPTPMMQQYLALKAECGDALLMFRMGDFYELFLDDAAVAAAALDIALTHRGQHLGEPLPMCGVPVHAHQAYVARLVKAGHRIAIAEQTEDPAAARKRGGKSVVRRAIVRVITPGTLTDEPLLDSRAANWLLAVFPAPAGRTGADGTSRGAAVAGLAMADISTGAFQLGEVALARVGDEIARLSPAEILLPDGGMAGFADLPGPAPRPLPAAVFDSRAALAALCARFAVATLDGFGAIPRAALAAAGGLLHHIRETARGASVRLDPPRLIAAGRHMAIDAATRQSLDLGGLAASIDRTITAAGSRRLAADLAAPLTDLAAIARRHDLVQWFAGSSPIRDGVRALLRGAPDIARALGRVAAGRGLPRDLVAIRQALDTARSLAETLAQAATTGAPAALGELISPGLDTPAELAALLARALAAEVPAERGAPGLIAAGFDPALDELRALQSDSRAAIAALEAELRASSGVAQLRIRHNNVLGYHVEVATRYADPLMAHPDYQHRQTMAGAIRFDTAPLRDLATRLASAEAKALAAEADHLAAIEAAITDAAADLSRLAGALAAVDSRAALADLAARANWVRPQLTEGIDFHVVAGRHPLVEAALAGAGQPFVANDCRLEDDRRLWLVTGPNMGGKSTFLRQNALIAVLAQAGGFVPAASATLGIVDRLYSRVGAADNLAEGRSTFMVEMVETAAILNGATRRSLLLLDEVGRGTATWDGLALAWAIVERIHDQLGARCLFATHYHELAALDARLAHLSLHRMKVRQWQGRLIFLHEVGEGAAPGSFGLDVARLAGVPDEVLARAGEILARLEAGDAGHQARAALADLPLFAAAGPPEVSPQPPSADPVHARLADVHPDSLSPRAALELIYELKALLADSELPD